MSTLMWKIHVIQSMGVRAYLENKFLNTLNNMLVEFDSLDCTFGNIGHLSP